MSFKVEEKKETVVHGPSMKAKPSGLPPPRPTIVPAPPPVDPCLYTQGLLSGSGDDGPSVGQVADQWVAPPHTSMLCTIASSVILAGLGLATLGFGARFVIRTIPSLGKKMADTVYNPPKLDSKVWANSKYYKGGFDPKMTKREAALILNISPNASQQKVRVRQS
ncbi:Mitochondrial import inner membrane translocase subunit TIM14 [Chionoecetes opilio]|uniref:Mitochondrial import inner membrane translocase subunit TIM14 n=1 Tax=Chionoecetes opilio TaxID=41210 RepID=A0A8J5D2P1_CHIOP|nr:Mitochondrial import inner membrane translocase subunit TIM14 [Chionoecetes opilio]